ncbi:MAG: hypothetical protein AB7F75_04425 [Planctomycetota bacterium]
MPILGLLIAIVIAAFIFLRAGSDSPAPSVNPADGKATINRAGHDLQLSQIRQQLQLYKAEHGAYPESLNKLDIEIPAGLPLDYNAQTGEVNLAR